MEEIFTASSFFMLFASRTRQNSHVEALCLGKNLFSWKNLRKKNFHGKKKKKKEYHSIKKRKKPSVKATGGVQISNKEVASKTKFVILKVKNEFSFYFCKKLALVLLFKLAAAAKLKNHIRG